ncbi:MAG: SRPBCC family protein, partial [Dehalococcoidia bacterium]|nr:SRPBCC family protein [Dehalococcoidia bacterium]
MAAEYIFIDEWAVDAPINAVFSALADARTYPAWWKPVYLEVTADCPPTVGCVSRQQFKGRLPYHVRTTSEIVRMDPPRELEVKVEGDLSGRGTWTLTPTEGHAALPVGRVARER